MTTESGVSIHGSRGARHEPGEPSQVHVGFNPRARVEPDFRRGKDIVTAFVSIHGLAWSPTYAHFVSLGGRMFQSTGSRGARHDDGKLGVTQMDVSIHGLAWSPTSTTSAVSISTVFQSTGSRGARRRYRCRH